MASEQEVCVCLSVWIKGSMADSAVVQCHTGSPSGMFLSPGMGCGASLAEPPLPVPCQPALGTAHLRCTLGERQLPVNHFRLWVSFCHTVFHLAGGLLSEMASLLACFYEHLSVWWPLWLSRWELVILPFHVCFFWFFLSTYFQDKHFKLLRPQDHAALLHCVNTVIDWIPRPPLSSTSHVYHSEEAQCGFKGHTSMSCFTLFTINPSMLPPVFTVQWRKASGKGNIKQSEQYNAEQTLLTHLGISSRDLLQHTMLLL